MEHITVKPFGARYYKLIPDEGYVLTDGRSEYSSAVVRRGTETDWKAIEISETE